MESFSSVLVFIGIMFLLPILAILGILGVVVGTWRHNPTLGFGGIAALAAAAAFGWFATR